MLPHQLTEWAFWNTLGIEPLVHSSQELAAQFKLHKGSIKSVLLNQKIVAGIGNIYADESLFKAGILPDSPCAGLSTPTLEKLAQAVQAVLHQSIKECGSSIRNYRDANGNVGAFQNSFYVYGRKNESCRLCNTPLVLSKIAGRTTMHCPSCQG